MGNPKRGIVIEEKTFLSTPAYKPRKGNHLPTPLSDLKSIFTQYIQSF